MKRCFRPFIVFRALYGQCHHPQRLCRLGEIHHFIADRSFKGLSVSEINTGNILCPFAVAASIFNDDAPRMQIQSVAVNIDDGTLVPTVGLINDNIPDDSERSMRLNRHNGREIRPVGCPGGTLGIDLNGSCSGHTSFMDNYSIRVGLEHTALAHFNGRHLVLSRVAIPCRRPANHHTLVPKLVDGFRQVTFFVVTFNPSAVKLISGAVPQIHFTAFLHFNHAGDVDSGL